MDERSYIENKQKSWQQLSDSIEQIRKRGYGSLSKEQLTNLGAQYRTVVSDLSFVRTQGASRNLVNYLNELAARAHGVLYASKSAKLRGAVDFIFREFPQLFRSTFNYTFVAAVIFFSGWILSAYMVKSGIKPPGNWDMPDAMNPASMSSFIMTNNIRVGILAFAAGLTAGTLTVYLLFYNGMHIGYVAASLSPAGRAAFWEFVPPHGIIELTAIFICGGAGLMIGAAFVAPGNLRRSHAIRFAANKALKLFAGTIPFYIIAGIIEGFISPSALPPIAKHIFAGLTGITLILYLGWAGNKSKDEKQVTGKSETNLIAR